MTRILTLIVMIVAMSLSGLAIAAQGTPASTGSQLAELGYPEVVITLTEAGFEVPDDVQAGTILLTFVNNAPFPAGFALIQLPEGVSMADLMPPAAASPESGASPAAEEGPGFPPVLFDAIWAGGAGAGPGQTGQAIVTLSAGEWILDAGPDAGFPPAILNVTGDAEGAIEAPEGAVTIELDNFQILLPEEIPAGLQTWHATNIGDQPHEVFVTRTPERLTVEEAMALLQMDPTAEPDPSLPNPEEFQDVGFVAPISQDRSVLVSMNLEPGHYVVVCFMPTKGEEDVPHAFKGMVTIFSIGADGEEVEPPASPVPEEHEGH